jgi:hypothetical protein
VAALSRRIMLMEEEAKKSEQTLADTVTKLAVSSKVGDNSRIFVLSRADM